VIDVAVARAAGRVNVALNRTSWQSSIYCDHFACRGPERVFDGVGTQSHYQLPGCAHTETEWYPWVAVDLMVPIYVDGVDVTARLDCCGA